jgi:hypothetical protein
MTFEIRSTAFAPGEVIPRRHSREGDDLSPHLYWKDEPAGTRSFALVCDDPDAPRAEPWVHWVVWGIPPGVHELDEGDAGAATEGANDFGDRGWGGPLPPKGHGPHRYQFHLYALDAAPSLDAGATKAQLLAAVRGHVLAEAAMVGTYERR